MMEKQSLVSVLARRSFSRYPVRATDFFRRAAREVLLKMSREARKAVMSATDGLESCQPPAPAMGVKRFSIAKRLLLSLPHHPLSLGT